MILYKAQFKVAGGSGLQLGCNSFVKRSDAGKSSKLPSVRAEIAARGVGICGNLGDMLDRFPA